MEIKFAYTILYVADVAQTAAFYQQAFGFQEKLLTPEKDYAEIHSGSTTLAFASLELGQANLTNGFVASSMKEKPFGIELAFSTTSVAEVMALAIKHGATELEKPSTKPWGQIVGYLRDPNGILLEICSPLPEA